MKKYWCIAFAVVLVLLVAGGVYVNYQKNHADSSYDAIPRELREEMMAHWPKEEYGDGFFGNKNVRYYGTHGDCVAFRYIGSFHAHVDMTKEIAGSTFYLGKPFSIVVYRNGEFIGIQEAYDRGWLNRWQIQSMAEYHKQISGQAAEN